MFSPAATACFLKVAARLAAGALLALGPCASMAVAHPHVTVTARAVVNIDKGTIKSVTNIWTFDEFYSAAAVEGLPKNAQGGYGREELAELSKVNVEGLKEFGYFTIAALGAQQLKVGDPAAGTYFSEHKDGVLTLTFTVPLTKPVLAGAKDFSITIADPSYFIAFEMAETEPAKLNDGAPKNCRAEVGVPKAEADAQKKLSGVFAEQLGGAAMGMGPAKSIMVICAP